jgi:hypothetical protein
MNKILMVQILDYQDSPPSVSARFWWSSDRGLTCDKPWLFAVLQQEGIIQIGQHRVYPSDGRAFFDALPFRFTGLQRAEPAVVVDQQGGEAP